MATWGKSTRLGSGGRKRPLGWEKEAGTREAPSCWAVPTAPSELGRDHTTSQPQSLRGRSPSLSPTPTPIVGWVSPGGRGLLKQVSVVWTLLPPTCQGDQPGSFSRARSPHHSPTWRLPALALGPPGWRLAPFIQLLCIALSPGTGTSALGMNFCRPLSH